MSAVNDTVMLTCANCAIEFPQPPVLRGGRVRRFCTPKCRVAGANARRQTTRAGRIRPTDTIPTYPHAGKAPGQPVASEAMHIPPSDSRALSDARSARISALMTLAHSRGGIDPWQIAELAKLKNISPWAPLRVILGHKDGMK
jgi:hypothetical protein